MKIISPSRLHLGLIDLNGTIGRIDGGVGISLDYPNFILSGTVEYNNCNNSINNINTFNNFNVEVLFNNKLLNNYNINYLNNIENRIKYSANKVFEYINKINKINKTNTNYNFYLEVHNIIPQHSGLGSGTQISLTTGKLISELLNYSINSNMLSKITGRGGTSGIGVYSFDRGGFIIDGGHTFGKNKEKEEYKPSSASKNISVAPLLFRKDFNWDIVLTIPKGENICGDKEIDIFKKYCPISLNEIEKISHIILMNLMPSLITNDFNNFGKGINQLQKLGFKSIEVKLQKEIVKNLLWTLQKIAPSGLSSFGPTIYSICNNKNMINEVVEYSKGYLNDLGVSGEVIVVSGNNEGFKIVK